MRGLVDEIDILKRKLAEEVETKGILRRELGRARDIIQSYENRPDLEDQKTKHLIEMTDLRQEKNLALNQVRNMQASLETIGKSVKKHVDEKNILIEEAARLRNVIKKLEESLQENGVVIQSILEKSALPEEVKQKAKKECPVCLENYSEEVKPIVLSCGHSLCLGCRARLVRVEDYTCPKCRVEDERLAISVCFDLFE
jgi:hypothetical protein